MAIRLFTNDDDNLWIKQQIIDRVRFDMQCVIPVTPWALDDQQRLTLIKPRFRDRAFFRMTAFPGSGMISFDLEPAPNTCMEPEIYNQYHEVLLDYIYYHFSGRFYLAERIAFEDRRPKLDIPPHLQPSSPLYRYGFW